MFHELIELGKRVLTETDVHRVLKAAIDGAIEIVGAERGMIILFGEDQEILFETARNLEKKDIENPEFEISRTIIGRVKRTGESIYLHNALEEPSLKRSASNFCLKILSVVCLPLRSGEQTFGVVYLDNRTVEGAFEPEDCEFADSFADFISLAAHHALDSQRLHKRVDTLERELRTRYDFNTIVGHSPQMIEVLQLISEVADTEVPVLIEGETGTGKELVARAIHFNSSRRDMPLVNMNCAAIPENLLESELFGHERGAFTGAFKTRKGKFGQAEKGTIFLDEVDEMSPGLQVKLLRILQWGEFNPLGSEEAKTCDVRVVAAAKQNLKQLVDDGKFRDDLYYRLNLIRIEIPPLRDRKDDILLLANTFLKDTIGGKSTAANFFSESVQQTLQGYNYPGNVRELENIIKRSAILCKGNTIELEHLPAEIRSQFTSDGDGKLSQTFRDAKQRAVEEFEKQYLVKVLKENDGVIRRAAKKADMQEKNFHLKLDKYGLRSKRTSK